MHHTRPGSISTFRLIFRHYTRTQPCERNTPRGTRRYAKPFRGHHSHEIADECDVTSRSCSLHRASRADRGVRHVRGRLPNGIVVRRHAFGRFRKRLWCFARHHPERALDSTSLAGTPSQRSKCANHDGCLPGACSVGPRLRRASDADTNRITTDRVCRQLPSLLPRFLSENIKLKTNND